MTSRRKSVYAVIGTVIGPVIPGAYMAFTGHTPMWARVWYGAWLAVWALATIGKAATP